MGAVIPALIGGLALAVVSSKATPLAPKPTALEWSPVAAGGAGIGAIGKTAGATCVGVDAFGIGDPLAGRCSTGRLFTASTQARPAHFCPV